MNKAQSHLLEQIKQATKGLMFMSESDYPLNPITIPAEGRQSLSAKDVLAAMGHSQSKKVQTMSVEDFFESATTPEDWHGPEEQEAVRRFKNLVKVLKENLSNIQVYKVGKTEFDVYVVGKSETGDFAGVSTKVVET